MHSPGPSCLEKALSNEIYVNISKYPLDNDFSGGKFYPAMNKCKHKKVRISNWMRRRFEQNRSIVVVQRGKKAQGMTGRGKRRKPSHRAPRDYCFFQSLLCLLEYSEKASVNERGSSGF